MDMDINIGRVLARLEALGLADSTYVLFTSDHGAQGPNSNLPLNEGKGTVWEGGIRVPFFVRGPGVRAGASSRVRTSGVDIFPTVAALAGVSLNVPQVEGASLTSLLLEDATDIARTRAEFVVHFPHYDHDPLGPASTILLGDYKLTRFYETGERRLFNLASDLGESMDLAARDPARVMEMDQRLTDYLLAVNAQMPTRR
jgi:arylsulfatase A-like enzyme